MGQEIKGNHLVERGTTPLITVPRAIIPATTTEATVITSKSTKEF